MWPKTAYMGLVLCGYKVRSYSTGRPRLLVFFHFYDGWDRLGLSRIILCVTATISRHLEIIFRGNLKMIF